ncbi:MAG: DNA translocase FtsK [Myxococcota bacterium]
MSNQPKELLGGFGALVGERWREIALIGALLVNLFAMLALMGYAPDDPTWLHPNTGRVSNPCGPVGALLADALFQVFGYGAWGAFGAMVLCVLALAGRPVFAPVRAVNAGALYIAVLGLAHIGLRPGGAFPPGGKVGQTAAEGLEAGVGTVGASLALMGVAIITVTILGNIRWGSVARRIVEAAEARWPAVREVLGQGASGVGAAGRRGLAYAFGRARGLATGAVGSSVGLASRVAKSFQGGRRTSAEPDSLIDELEADPHLLVPSESIATAHSVPVVAEVEWDPTVAGEASDIREMFNDLAPRNVQDRSSGGSSFFSTSGAGSHVQPEPLGASEHTQPGQFEHTVASDEDDFDSDPDALVTPVKMTFGDTLTPPAAERDSEAEGDDFAPAEVHTPRPPAQRQQLGVEIARALEQKVSDDGGSLNRRKGWSNFKLPKLSLLDIVPEQKAVFDSEELRRLAQKVEETLESFKVTGQVTNVRVGPVVTIFEYSPDAGIKVSRIANLSDDLAMSLCATNVRIVAPIPGKGVVGIEIPSPTRLNIYFREILGSDVFRNNDYELPVALGKDVEGNPVIANLVKMPHLLVAGTTGAGKSVGVNGMLVSLLYTCTPEDLRLLLIDPKQLEFKMYDDIPHLLHPVVTDPKLAQSALDWAVREMEDRYTMLARWNTRNIVSFNEKVERESKDWTPAKARQYAPDGWEEGMALPKPEKMPFIVIVIDELADLMMVARKEIEQSIARLAQKARACGIHLILATQRPSADVVTGLIKANMPTRIAFKLKSALDSRVILDENGAERLLGRGDLLHSPNGGLLERIHGAFVSDEEVERVCDYVRSQAEPDYIDAITAEPSEEGGMDESERDPMFADAVEVVLAAGKASTSMIQRHLKIGYNRAARIIDQMEMCGVVGPADGARPREVLVSENVF